MGGRGLAGRRSHRRDQAGQGRTCPLCTDSVLPAEMVQQASAVRRIVARAVA